VGSQTNLKQKDLKQVYCTFNYLKQYQETVASDSSLTILKVNPESFPNLTLKNFVQLTLLKQK
jgi:hypothetical protein